MRIAVCDDEQCFLNYFRGIVDRLYNRLDIITDEFNSGDELLKSFKYKAYDLVFLDIEMPDMDGITLARMLRELSADVCIVFLTGHIEYAIKGYEVNALRYLTKPAEEKKLREVIDYVQARLDSGKVIWVSTAADSFSVRGNISDYEKELEQYGFFRVHRSYLISMPKVLRIESRNVVMEDNTSLPVSRSKESALREKLFSYVSREAF